MSNIGSLVTSTKQQTYNKALLENPNGLLQLKPAQGGSMPPLSANQPMLLNTRQPPVRNAFSNDKKDAKDDLKAGSTFHEKRLSSNGLLAKTGASKLPAMKTGVNT